MDLFEYMRQNNMEKESPLAARLRPTTLDEVVGQQHIIGKDTLLYHQSGQVKLPYFLRPTRNRQDYAGKGDCRYDQCGFYAD